MNYIFKITATLKDVKETRTMKIFTNNPERAAETLRVNIPMLKPHWEVAEITYHKTNRR